MKRTLFQHSTIAALMDGLFEGTIEISSLLSASAIGIGTLDGLDGELIILDGVAYQIDVEGRVKQLSGNEKSPYAAVTDFVANESITISETLSELEFKEKLKQHFESKNTFQAVKVTGTFKEIICRSVAKQEPPYPRLPEVAADQAEFKAENIKGTMVGFYTPEIYGTLAVPEFHLHFLSEEKDFGGHVLHFVFDEGKVEWQMMEKFLQDFPTENETFLEADISYKNLADDIETSE